MKSKKERFEDLDLVYSATKNIRNKLTFEKIISFCDSEKWEKSATATKIGF
jgi:hypothetical protein